MKKLTTVVALTTTLMLMPVYAYSEQDNRQNASSPGSEANTSRYQTFDEIFFADGPNAESLGKALNSPEYDALVNAQKEQPSAVDAEKRELHGLIEEKDPNFFERFKTDVHSGNPLKTERAIISAGSVLSETVEAELKKPDSNVSPQCAIIVAWTVGVVVNVGLAVNIETAVNVHHKAWLASRSNALISEDAKPIERQHAVMALVDTYGKQ